MLIKNIFFCNHLNFKVNLLCNYYPMAVTQKLNFSSSRNFSYCTTDISYFEHFYCGCAMTVALRMCRKLNEFRMTNFLELASPLPKTLLKLRPLSVSSIHVTQQLFLVTLKPNILRNDSISYF